MTSDRFSSNIYYNNAGHRANPKTRLLLEARANGPSEIHRLRNTQYNKSFLLMRLDLIVLLFACLD